MSPTTTSPESMSVLRRTISRVLMLLFAFGVLAGSPPQLRADDAADQYNLAVGFYKQKRWNFSSEAFEKFITTYPQHEKVPAAELYLGLSLVKEEKYDAARKQLRPYAEKYPDSKYLPDALYQLAESSYFLNDYETAAADFQTMLAKFPDHTLAEWGLTYLGNSQLKLEQYEAAIQSYQQALEKFPTGTMAKEARFGLAQAQEGAGQLDEAAATYREIIAAKGRHASSAYLKLAALEYEREQFESALAVYREFQQAFPQDEQIGTSYLNAGYTYFRMNNYSAARDAFQHSAKSASLARTANYWTALCYKAQEQYAEAIQILKQMYDEDRATNEPERPLQAEVVYHLADAQLRLGNDEVALERFLEVTTRWPDAKIAENALHFASVAAFQADDLDKAAELTAQFEERYPESQIGLSQQLLKGRLLAARGGEANLEEAATILREVLADSSLPRTQTLARLHLAHTLTQQKDYQEAMAMLEPLLAGDGVELHADEQKDLLLLAGLSQKELGNHDEAAQYFQQYLLKYPKDERAAQIFSELLNVRAKSGDLAVLQVILDQLKSQAETNGLPADSSYLSGLRMAAETAYKAENWAAAEVLFRALVDLAQYTPSKQPTGADLSGLAWSQFKQEKWTEAIENFNTLLATHGKDPAFAPEALLMVGRAQEELGNTNEALAAYAQLRDSWFPTDTEVLPAGAEDEGATHFIYLAGLQAARLLKSQNNYNGANQVYGRLADAFPNAAQHAELLDEWALMNLDAGFYSQADEIYKRLVETHSDSGLADNAKLSLAESQLLAGERGEAKEAFAELRASEQSDPKVKEAATFQLIGIANSDREFNEAIELAKEFLNRWPESEFRTKVETSFLEALLETDQEARAEEILTNLEQSVAPEDRSTELWILLAEVAYRKKDYPAALSILEQFRESNADRKYFADEMEGRIYKNQARFDEARTAFQRVLTDAEARKTPTGAKSQLMLADTYFIQKDYQTAQKEYYKLFLSWPYDEWQAPALFQVARCDELLNQPEQARITYKKVISEFPESKYSEQARERLEVVGDGANE
ncbi:MAG: hypothetical protein CMJ46_15595 [Planctomyces sp.]|nr:hypothetical protein [Planctomyces sp.]